MENKNLHAYACFLKGTRTWFERLTMTRGFVAATVIFLSGMLFSGHANAQVCFGTQNNFGGPNVVPTSITSADFNHDGWDDFAELNSQGNAVLVYLNNQHGGYTLATYSAGGLFDGGFQIINADFNGDGFADLAIALGDDGNAGILLNDKSGGFGGGVTLVSTGSYGGNNSIVAADFNGDNIPDIAIIDPGNNMVDVALNNGDGTFGAVNMFTTDDGGPNSPNTPMFVASGDFNNDNNIDLVTANQQGDLSILLGDGAGNFNTVSTISSTLFYPVGVLSADFNHDGNTDIAVVDNSNNDVAIFLGNGDGSFQADVDYTVGAAPEAIVAADFNGDGVLDLATANNQDNDISILIGNNTGGGGDGTFQTAVDSLAGQWPVGIASGDMNHDGHADILACNSQSGDVSLFLNTGTFSSPYNLSMASAVSIPPPAADNTPYAIASADFNEDGVMDLVVASNFDNYISVYIGSGDGTFGTTTDYSLSSASTSVYCADLDGSGHQSIVTTSNGNNSINVLLGNGSGTFSSAVSYTTVTGSGGSTPNGVIAGKFLSEIKTDLITANGDGTLSALSSNGTGHFNAPVNFYTVPGGANLVGITSADFNHDGNPDVAVLGSNGNLFELLCNVGDPPSALTGSATLNATVTAGLNTSSVTNGDFNGDGWADLAVTNEGDNSVSVFLNDGAGGFSTSAVYSVGYSPTSIAVADFNNDGFQDIVTANSQDGTVSILLGDGSGGFTAVIPPLNVGSGFSAQTVTTGDFNKDGSIDIATANPYGPSQNAAVSVLLNTAPTRPETPGGPAALCQGSSPSAYTASSPDATSYIWSVTPAAGTISGTSTTGTVTWNATYTGTATVSVQASNPGCGASAATTKSVTVNSAPANPVATAGTGATNTQITANWNTVPGATGYFLDVSTGSGFGSFVGVYNNLSVGNVVTENVTGLSSGATYFYRVRAATGTCTSGNSNTISYATTNSVGCPFIGGTITTPFVIICNGSTTTLTDVGSTGNNYIWQISPNNTTWTDITGATNTSYTTASADGSSNKFYRLMSKSTACWNVTSNTAEVDVSNASIAVTATNVTDNSLTLNWSPTGSGNYLISYSGATSGTQTSVTPPKTITGLTSDGSYSVTVTQTGVSGCSASGTLASVNTLCAMPTGVALSTPAVGQIKVSWTGTPGADYRVYYRPLFSYNTYFTKDVNNLSSVVLTKQGNNNLYASNTYEVYVAQLNCPTTGAVGQGTNLTYITTLSPVACPTPVIDSVRSLCPVQIEVFIHPGSSPTGNYNVYLQRITPSILAVNSYGVSGNYFTINTPYSGDEYLIAVDSRCAGGALSSLAIWQGVSLKPLCSSPTNLVLSNPTCHGFTASWNSDQCLSNLASLYSIYIRQAGLINFNSYGVALPAGGLAPFKGINWLFSGINYQVSVRTAYNCNGYITYGPSTPIQTITTLSSGCRDEEPADETGETKPAVQQYSGDNQEVFSLYPNPNNGEFVVDLSRLSMEEDAVKIEVFNMLGQTIVTHLTTISGGQMVESVHVPNGTAAGTYIVRLTAGKNVYTAKINVSR